jgi:hypothetical protein
MRLIGLAVVLTLSLTLAPLAAEGQQTGKIYRLGWFAFSPPTNPEALALHDAFLQELRAQGFVEGQNVRIERRYTEGREERAAALAAEFVSMKVDPIFATYSGAVRAAKEATSRGLQLWPSYLHDQPSPCGSRRYSVDRKREGYDPG